MPVSHARRSHGRRGVHRRKVTCEVRHGGQVTDATCDQAVQGFDSGAITLVDAQFEGVAAFVRRQKLGDFGSTILYSPYRKDRSELPDRPVRGRERDSIQR